MTKEVTKGNSIFELADKTGAWKVKGPSTNYISGIVPKTISQTRQDIKTWTNAQNMAMVEENPKFFPIQNLYDNILKDLHLQSQVNNRMLKSLSRPFSIKNADGKTNDDLTTKLQDKGFVFQINKAILETVYRRHSLGEFSYK